MTQMIERWFPCQEVSANSDRGWGSGNSEVKLFSWFAKRPLVQARAAVITSLLPWPDAPSEQARLQDLVRKALGGMESASADLLDAIAKAHPEGASLLDPFSGRGIVPLESARLGVRTWGIDYSPVACAATRVLAQHPMTVWDDEPELPLEGYDRNPLDVRLVADVSAFLGEVWERASADLAPCYPSVGGRQPWGYLWATTIPCKECGNYFPLIGALTLRAANSKKNDKGQSLHISGSASTGQLEIRIDTGPPTGSPTRVVGQGKSKYDAAGKVAVCSFCSHVHPKDVHTRLVASGQGRDLLLAVADNDDHVQRTFRLPTEEDLAGLARVHDALLKLEAPAPGMAAVPTERIPENNTWTIQGQVFGAQTYGDLCSDRQNLSFAMLTSAVRRLSRTCLEAGVSEAYVRALADYACSVLVRRLKFSTRGARLRTPAGSVNVSDVFGNSESSWSYQYDYLETGLADGPGTWPSLSGDTVSVLRRQFQRSAGRAAIVQRGSATSLPFPSARLSAVVTDPPYDAMIDYTDASDLYFVWMKRALAGLDEEFGLTSDPLGLQEKDEEIIVKKGNPPGDHRTPAHYDELITTAFTEAARVVEANGVVTIVFGHGDPEVWHRLLAAVTQAGLVLTGSWPARTEKEKTGGGSNIVTTLTLACRKAPLNRVPGRVADVDSEVRAEIESRIPIWEAAGLALTDQLMASAGPAMEVVGRYSVVSNKRGDPVELDRYLPLARRAVEESANIKIDALPLGTFDARTRFALFWVRVNGRNVAPASEARWQRLASDLTESDTAGILIGAEKGMRLARSNEAAVLVDESSAVIDVALAAARAWAEEGLSGAAQVLVDAGRTEDPYLWGAFGELSGRVPDGDPDGQAWTSLIRNRSSMESAAGQVAALRHKVDREEADRDRQGNLFG